MSTWIVLPTYNEAENIGHTVVAIRSIVEADIVVVDDHSPDGTGVMVEEMTRHDPRLHVLHRSAKLGLGTAYQEGFRYVLTRGATTVIQMDADGSHDPSVIPHLIKNLQRSDLVLGSRYVAGGGFPIVWYRRWISTVGNTYIRMLLGWRIHDWSTGFKAWQAPFLSRLMAEQMQGQGYAWLMEMTWLAVRLGGRISEVPLVFLERKAGESKFSFRIALEDIRLAYTLWRR